MDQDWLESVLSESESDGVTWAVFRSDELVAIVETIFSPLNELAGIPGIATAAIQHILKLNKSQGIQEHIA